MSEHESVQEMLSLAAAGVLEAGDQRRVDQHVAACEACRRELDVWRNYARELTRLPVRATPRDLVARTCDRILARRAAAADRRWDEAVLAVLALFAWTTALVTWFLVKLVSGGLLAVIESGFLNAMVWSAGSTGVAWLTAAVAAVMLGSQRRRARRMI